MEDYGDYHADTLEGWVISKVDEWEDHYRSNYENQNLCDNHIK